MGFQRYEAPRSHSRLLPLMVGQLMSNLNADGKMLDALALSSGPGSYTGLRIGFAVAKGMCLGWNLPLISIPTLEILMMPVQGSEQEVLVPMIPVGTDRVCYRVADQGGEGKILTGKVRPGLFDSVAPKHPVLIGKAAERFAALPDYRSLTLRTDVCATADMMGKLAWSRFGEGHLVELEKFEPVYGEPLNFRKLASSPNP